MDCTIIGVGTTISYEQGFIRENGVVIAAVKNVLYTEAVECNIKLMNAIYDQPRPITDDSLDVMNSLSIATRVMFHWL